MSRNASTSWRKIKPARIRGAVAGSSATAPSIALILIRGTRIAFGRAEADSLLAIRDDQSPVLFLHDLTIPEAMNEVIVNNADSLKM